MKPERTVIKPPQWMLAFLLLGMGLAGLYHAWVARHHLDHTAALFIGIPTILAVVLALTPRLKTTAAMILKGMTIALLMSAVFLREGFICILMSSPLFYAVGLAISSGIDFIRKKKEPPQGTLYAVGFLSLFALMSLEGATEELSFPRNHQITVEKIVSASPEAVRAKLAERPIFNRPFPLYFHLGFPLPVATTGEGLSVGDHRQIRWAGGRAVPGDLVLGIVESAPGRVRFGIEKDESYLTHWLNWTDSLVEWQAMGDGQTRVRWTLGYRRRLDPAWYFGPWEQYAVRLAAEVLIDNLATPDD